LAIDGVTKYFHNQGSKDQHIYIIPKETLTFTLGNILKTLNPWSGPLPVGECPHYQRLETKEGPLETCYNMGNGLE
jgi:hypothetical protein